MAIIDAVTSNTSIEILCIVDHDPDREAYVKQQIEEYQASVQQPYVDGGDSVLSRNASLWPDT